jgi:hypothetical protein
MAKINKGSLSDAVRRALPKKNDKPANKPEKAKPKETKPSSDRVSTSKSKKPKDLEDRPETSSSPLSSKRVTKKQAETASGITGGSSDFDKAEEAENDQSVARFAGAAEPGAAPEADQTDAASETDEAGEAADTPENDELDHIVDDPAQQEQRADIRPPEGFQPGSPVQPPPDLTGAESTGPPTDLPTGGTQKTYEKDGVTYTQTTKPNGIVDTSYEVDGVDYTNTQYEDGRSTTNLSTSGDNGSHSRTVELDARGQLQLDKTYSTDAATDPKTGNIGLQSRSESLGPDGVRTITEEVTRPDGGKATLNRTEHPDNRVEETYEFTSDKSTLNRTTNQAADGTAETRTERSYTSDRPIEELVDGPPVPDHAGPVLPLPEGQREPTRVNEVSVVTTDAGGTEELQHEEKSYSQTSGDVQLNGSREQNGDSAYGDTFPQGFLPNNDGSNITHTVSTVSTRDENGRMVTETGASQSVVLAGDRLEDDREVSVARTESWNSKGESSTSFTSDGFERGELLGLSSGTDDNVERFNATVGGQPFYSAGFPRGDKSPFDHLNMKGGGDAENWLDIGLSSELDVNVTVSRNSKGEEQSNAISYSTVGENGEGKTVTRTNQQGGAVAWTYADYANRGNDHQKQTVFEGTDISIYETQTTHGADEFTRTSETKEGDEVVASSETSRRNVDQEALQTAVANGELTQEQFDRMISDGPPYTAERHVENAEPLKDDGELREDEDGNPIQPGHHVSSYTFSNDQGYAVAEHYRMEESEDGRNTDSRLSTVTDPNADPPVDGSVVKRERNPETGTFRVTEDSKLQVMGDGRLMYGDEDDLKEVGSFDFAGSDITTLLREGENITASELVGLASGAAEAGQDAASIGRVGHGRFNLTGEAGNLARFQSAADIFGLAGGVQSLYAGVTGADGRAAIEGFGDIAGGLNSLAAATKALGGSSRLGTAANRFSTLTAGSTTLGKVLGGAGGVISLGFGLYDVFTAESGYDQAAGGLTAAAGAVALGSAFFGPPGWVVGGLVSGALGITAIFVGDGDKNQTADIDSRLQ